MASMCQPSKNLPVVADQNEEISGDNWEEEEEFDEGDAVFSSDECEDVADKDEDAEQKEKGGDSMDFQEDTKPQQPEGKGRIKRQCPVPYCKKKVVHIPRHLVNVHGWSYSRSRAAVTQFNLRKKYTFKSQETAEAGNRKKKQTPNGKCPACRCNFNVKLVGYLSRRCISKEMAERTVLRISRSVVED